MYILLRTYFTLTLLEIRLLDSKLSMSVAFYFLSSVVSENYFVPACEGEILRQCIMCVERAPWKVFLLSISEFTTTGYSSCVPDLYAGHDSHGLFLVHLP